MTLKFRSFASFSIIFSSVLAVGQLTVDATGPIRIYSGNPTLGEAEALAGEFRYRWPSAVQVLPPMKMEKL